MRVLRYVLMFGLCVVWLFAVGTYGQTAQTPGQTQPGQAQAGQPPASGGRPLNPKLLNLTKAGPNRADEPYAKTLSLEKTRDFLDEMAVNWTHEMKCGTCHTNIAYMIGRAALGPHTPAADEVRSFFTDRATRWDSMGNELIR